MEEQAATEALAERLFAACIGALDLLHVYVGDQLGLYGASPPTAPSPPASSPNGRAFMSATPGNGWSTRRSPVSSRSTAAPAVAPVVSPFHQATPWPCSTPTACRL